jgi:alpha-1,3-rhamnosyltransferase
MNYKVSIIIPSYNGEKYIQETIESCLNQTYNNLEIIVVDDCSTDNTLKILESFRERILLNINKNNLGIVKNVNRGISLSTGDFFILLGHDDILDKKHVENMLKEFNDEIVAVHCNSIVIDHAGREIKLARNDENQIKKTKNCMFELSIDNFISSCGMMHKSDVFKKIGGWDEQYLHYGEWLYYIKELQFGKIIYTTNVRAYYRKHETNITNTFQNKEIKKELFEYKQTCRELAHTLNNNSIYENIKFYIKK